jgi:hypothetical protein
VPRRHKRAGERLKEPQQKGTPNASSCHISEFLQEVHKLLIDKLLLRFTADVLHKETSFPTVIDKVAEGQ